MEPPRELKDVVGDNLRRIRGRLDLRQEDLAARARAIGLEWTQATVAAIETGRRMLSLGELVLFPSVLGIDREALLADLLDPHSSSVRVEFVDFKAPTWKRVARGESVSATQVRIYKSLLRSSVKWSAIVAKASRYGVQDENIYRAFDASQREAEQKVARNLGTDPLIVAFASVSLWGRGLSDERDRRFQKQPQGPGAAARRGHITRSLVNELEQRIQDREPRGGGRR